MRHVSLVRCEGDSGVYLRRYFGRRIRSSLGISTLWQQFPVMRKIGRLSEPIFHDAGSISVPGAAGKATRGVSRHDLRAARLLSTFSDVADVRGNDHLRCWASFLQNGC